MPKLFKIITANPLRIVATVFLLFLLFGFIGAPIAEIGHSGGEQTGFAFFATVFNVAWYATIAAGIISAFFYREWVKKHWIRYALVMAFLLFVVCSAIFRGNS